MFCVEIFDVIKYFNKIEILSSNKSFKPNTIYISILLYMYRLRVIGFPLNLWVGS